MLDTVCRYFFWFQLYSIAGWIVETLLYLFRDKRIVKRGFLFGPLCPIYGTGACILRALLYGRINNIFLIFILGLLLCGVLEYFTHFLMEKLFHAMWWDYSSRRFNIKGRVYLNGLLQFGLAAVLILKVVQPLFEKLADLMPITVLYTICFVLYSLALIDLCLTFSDLTKIVRSLKYLQSLTISGIQKGIDVTDETLKESFKNITGTETVKNFTKLFTDEKSLVQRIRKKYPNFTLKKYKYILDIIADKPQEDKARKDLKLYGTADSLPDPDEEKQ